MTAEGWGGWDGRCRDAHCTDEPTSGLWCDAHAAAQANERAWERRSRALRPLVEVCDRCPTSPTRVECWAPVAKFGPVTFAYRCASGHRWLASKHVPSHCTPEGVELLASLPDGVIYGAAEVNRRMSEPVAQP